MRFTGTTFEHGEGEASPGLNKWLQKKAGQAFTLYPDQKLAVLRGRRADGTTWKVLAIRPAAGAPFAKVRFVALPQGREITPQLADMFAEWGFIFYPHHGDLGIYEIAYPQERSPTVYNDLFYQAGYSSFSEQDLAAWMYRRCVLTNLPRAAKDTKYRAGPVTWFGHPPASVTEQVVVSYDHSLPTRYRLSRGHDVNGDYRYYHDASVAGEVEGYPCHGANVRAGRSDYVYVWGNAFEIPTGDIRGAGIFHGRMIYAANGGAFYASSANGWEHLGTYSGGSAVFRAPWFFSPSGDEASTITADNDDERPERSCSSSYYSKGWWVTDFHFITAHFTLDQGQIVLSFTQEDRVYPTLELPEDEVESEATGVIETCQPMGAWVYDVYHDGGWLELSIDGLISLYWDVVDEKVALFDSLYPDSSPHSFEDYRFTSMCLVDIAYVIASYTECSFLPSPGHLYGVFILNKDGVRVFGEVQLAYYGGRRNITFTTTDSGHTTIRSDGTGGARPVAIDYGFDGQKLLIEQYRTKHEATREEVIDYHRDITWTFSRYDDYDVCVTITQAQEYNTNLSYEWEMRINGEKWLDLTGNRALAFTSGGTEVACSHNDVPSEVTPSSALSGGGTTELEVVHLLDCDARSETIIYLLTEISETRVPDNTGFHPTGKASVRSAVRKMIVQHEGVTHILNEGTFTANEPGGDIIPNYPYYLHQFNENIVGGYCGTECLFGGQANVQRNVGSLCVRSPGVAAFSFSNESGLVDLGEGAVEQLKYVNGVIIDGEIINPTTYLDAELGASLEADDFRIRPIRAL